MKLKINKKSEGFKPMDLTITFETREEVESLIARILLSSDEVNSFNSIVQSRHEFTELHSALYKIKNGEL